MDNYKFIYIIKCSRYTLGDGVTVSGPPCPFDGADGARGGSQVHFTSTHVAARRPGGARLHFFAICLLIFCFLHCLM